MFPCRRSTKTWKAAVLVGLTAASGACSYTPTAPSPLTSSGTRALMGTVYPDGTTTMWLTIANAGRLSMTLTDAKPASITLGLALGVLLPEHTHCELTALVNAQGGSAPQITAPVTPGTYCVEVSDAGSVPASGTPFSISVLLQQP